METLEIMTQFTQAFPPWVLSSLGTGEYLLSYNMVTGSDTYGYNPENPIPSLKKGAYAPFVLIAVKNAVFDSNKLTFSHGGNTYICDGLKGTIVVNF